MFVFCEDLVIELQPEPLVKEHERRSIKGQCALQKYEDGSGKKQEKQRFRLTCRGNLCRPQPKCQARDFPSQRVCFHWIGGGGTKTYCIMHTPARQLCTNRTQTICGKSFSLSQLTFSVLYRPPLSNGHV